VAARTPISNTTTILDRVTDMLAPKNKEAETLQVTDSAPTPQKGEIGQRGVEAAPQWRRSGYWKLQRSQRANDHRWRGGDGRSVTTMPHRPGRGCRKGWGHLKNKNK